MLDPTAEPPAPPQEPATGAGTVTLSTRLVMLLEGIARTKGSQRAKQATAAGPEVLRRMLATRPGLERPLGARDRALLLLGFAGALRRSELVGLTLGDVEVVPKRGAGQAVAIWANPKEPGLCPARALGAWLGFRQGGGDHTGGVSDAALPLFVGLSKAGRLFAMALSDKVFIDNAAGKVGFRRLLGVQGCHRHLPVPCNSSQVAPPPASLAARSTRQ